MTEVQDFATLRALYEYAMEYYHSEKYKQMQVPYFEVLSGLTKE